jgi:Predicted thioesterase
MDHFSAKLELRIDWSEIDLFGHVNNVAFLKYIQAARVHYMEMIGLMQMQAETKKGPVLASVSCQFRKPLFYPGQVIIYSQVDSMKNTSLGMYHEIHDPDDEIVAEAQDIIVLYDFIKNAKLIIPDEIREKIERLEKRRFDRDS